jgi:hypothetical protein
MIYGFSIYDGNSRAASPSQEGRLALLNRVIAGALLVALGTVVGTWIAMSPVATTGTVVHPDRAVFAATDEVRPAPPSWPAPGAEAFLGVILAQQAVDIAAEIDGTIERSAADVGSGTAVLSKRTGGVACTRASDFGGAA